jgi:cobyrinic acid a,c-diamide synthase
LHYPRIMIAAPASGSGKTMISCGLLWILKKRGKDVSGFKCGPDYVDPLFHKEMIGVPSRNLDSFLMGEDTVLERFCANAKEYSVLEGVMGYYDGVGGISVQASSYDISRITKTPVILVVDTKGMSLSVVAIIKGFLEYHKDSRIRGVIFNRTSPMMYPRLKKAVEEELAVSVLGYLPFLPQCSIESRHLGLVTPTSEHDFHTRLQLLAEAMEKTVDIDGILKLAENAEAFCMKKSERKKNPAVCKVAVAKDDAFCFYYEDNLELLEKLGCEICFFSPLKDKHLPENVDGLLLGGGYPEVYAKPLSQNKSLLMQIKEVIKNGIPCVAECGGFLYLYEELEDLEGNFYPMVGAISGRAWKQDRLKRFGYSTLTAQKDTLLCKKGEEIPAHEFHYWDSENNGDAFNAKKPLGTQHWNCIHAQGNLFAGFPHMHFYGNIRFAENFVEKCKQYREEHH